MTLAPPSPRTRGRPKRTADQPSTGAERLLAVALEVFATQGFEGASVRSIAAQAEVDPALIKHQFGSKGDLWRAAVDSLSNHLLSALKPVDDLASDGPDQALTEAVSHLVDITCDDPRIAKFILSELVRQNEQSDYVFQKLVKPIHDLLMPLIAGACCTARNAPDPDLLFFVFSGAIVTAVAGRPFITRMSDAAASDAYFREHLKRTIVAQLLPDTARGT